MGLLDFASKLVATPSLSGNEGPALDLCEAEMAELGYRVSRDRLGNLVGVLGEGEIRLLFDAHVDTVDPDPGWSRDPFGGQIEGDFLYGLGATDMKGSAAAMIHGVAAASEEMFATVGVSLTTREEAVEGLTLRSVIERFSPDVVVIGEPTGLRLALAQRGRAEIVVEVVGRTAHAAYPEQGASALDGAVKVLESLEARRPPIDPDLGAGILVATMIASESPSVSTVPALCRIRFDRRTLPGETQDSVLGELAPHLQAAASVGATASASLSAGEIELYTGVRLDALRFFPAWRIASDAPLARAALAALGDVELSAYSFCTNGSLTAGELGIPTVGYGPGEARAAHTPDERIQISELEAGYRGFAALAAMRLH